MRPLAHWLVPGLLLLHALAPAPAAAERLADDRFALLGPHDGLDGRVLDIAQDPLGFLWFATTTGLHRYDGGRLVSFEHDPDDPHSISDDHVRKLLVDSAGTLWVATDGGLDHWLPAEERFRRLAQGLGGVPASLGEIAPGQLLVALQGADVVRVSTTDETVERIADLDSVDCLVVDSERGSVWGLGPHGLVRHALGDLSQQQRIPWPATFALELGLEQILGCTATQGGALWGTAYAGGAIRFDIESQELTEFRHAADDRGSLTGDDLTTVLEDSQGRLWIASFSGLNRLDPESLGFERFVFDPTHRQGLVNHQIHSLFEDRSGQLWLGTDTGVARFDPLRENFSFYSHGPGREVSAPPGSIRSFAEDEDGRLWIGSRSHGIARMDRRAGETIRYTADPEGDGLPDDTAWALHYEAPGHLWVGSESGLSRLEVGTGVWRTYLLEDLPPPPRVLTLFGDRWDSLWAAGDFDLHRYDRDSDTFPKIELGVESRVFAMTDASMGRLFVGTDGDGVLILDARHGHRRDGGAEGDDGAHWPKGQVSALVTIPGPPETVWAATLEQGLYRLEPDGLWSHFGRAQGLPSESVWALQAEEDGTLWLSTGLETLRYDPQTQTTLTFQGADGLPSLVHRRASFDTRGGELLFGGLDGFVAFSPDSIRVDTTPPSIVLTDFRIGNESMPPRARKEDSPLARSITLAEEVTLDHRQNDFTLELAALHFGDPERNRFAYRLEGVDIDWIEVPAERSFARYSGIPAGRYVFRARAANRDGIWSPEEARLEVRVLPAPWRSGWAWTLYAFAVVGFVAWWIRNRIVRLELEKELQQKELKILRGLLPICATCKKIRDDEGEWEPLETYLDTRSEAQFSHGICPQCAKEHYGFDVGKAKSAASASEK